MLTAADYVAKWDGTNWSALSSNGASNGSLGSGSTVQALAVSGTNLYVGGTFTDVNNNGTSLTAADYIAKWDGTNWSALGSNCAGDGSISSSSYVKVLAFNGTNLYVGGLFTNVNNSGTSLTAADYVAKYEPGDAIPVYADPTGVCGGNSPCNTSLQSAINAVAAGGTVRYYGGTYSESVSLNRCVTLDFVGSSNPTINGALSISTGAFNAPSAYTLSLTGNLANSGGTFNHNSGTFAFTGSTTQTVSSNFTFNNLTVNSGATVDAGANTLTVSGTSTNAGTIKRLTPAQNIALSTPFTFNDGIGQTAAIINQTAGTAMGNTTVQVNANTTTAPACSATTLGGTPVKRYFDITPTNGSSVTADVTLYFYDGASNSEANGNLLTNIALFHCEGGTWQRLSGTYTTGTSGNYNWVKLTGYTFTSFSPFAIGGGVGAPTAVTLSSFKANAPTFDLVAWFAQMLGRAR